MDSHVSNKYEGIAIIFVFCLLLYIPLIGGIIVEDKISSSVEKRNLAKFPQIPISVDEIQLLPNEINDYYADHFGFREVFTKLYFKVRNSLPGSIPAKDVTKGKNGWLFLGSVEHGYRRFGDPIGDAINANLYSVQQLEQFAKSIVSTKNWLESKGIKYIYVIVPEKHTIYFEQMPEYIVKINEKSATDQLVAYLQSKTDINVVDLRGPLLQEKTYRNVYHKNDSHWNHYGANIAQFEIMKNLEQYFPAKITSYKLDAREFDVVKRKGGDLATLANYPNVEEKIPKPKKLGSCTPKFENKPANSTDPITQICKEMGLNAVVFMNSFFQILRPYISRYFYRTTYIWESMNYQSLEKYVEKENPDVVIDQISERLLPYVPPSIGTEK